MLLLSHCEDAQSTKGISALPRTSVNLPHGMLRQTWYRKQQQQQHARQAAMHDNQMYLVHGFSMLQCKSSSQNTTPPQQAAVQLPVNRSLCCACHQYNSFFAAESLWRMQSCSTLLLSLRNTRLHISTRHLSVGLHMRQLASLPSPLLVAAPVGVLSSPL
jgi:hypothetical protein